MPTRTREPMKGSPPRMDTTTTRPPGPTVIADTGPDGRPTVMLAVGDATAVLDREAAASLITRLLAVLSGAGGAAAFCWAAAAVDTAGQVADALTG